MDLKNLRCMAVNEGSKMTGHLPIMWSSLAWAFVVRHGLHPMKSDLCLCATYIGQSMQARSWEGSSGPEFVPKVIPKWHSPVHFGRLAKPSIDEQVSGFILLGKLCRDYFMKAHGGFIV